MTDQVLTLRQVAAEVGISRQAVRQAIRDGRLTASVTAGKHLRCTRADVDAWLARRQEPRRRVSRRAAKKATQLDTLYEFIIDFKRQHGGRSPAQEECSAALGLRSRSGIGALLQRLADDGRIVLEGEGVARNIAIPGERWLAPVEVDRTITGGEL